MCCLEEVYKCNCDMFSFVNMYLDHLKSCVVCIEGMCIVVKLCTLGVFVLGVSLVS